MTEPYPLSPDLESMLEPADFKRVENAVIITLPSKDHRARLFHVLEDELEQLHLRTWIDHYYGEGMKIVTRTPIGENVGVCFGCND